MLLFPIFWEVGHRGSSLVELINKLPGEMHTIVYTDIFFLATNTSEMNSKGHELTVRLKVRLTLSVPQFLLWS